MGILNLDVTGMSCNNCVKHVTQALMSISGIEEVNIDLPTGRVTVEGEIPSDHSVLIDALSEEGYSAKVAT